ncbi:MAG: hypothetical protein HAW59_07275 [Betaproteobacteria bacterium]|nr:hypothetical protein [Betaproteobacteria bacterium]
MDEFYGILDSPRRCTFSECENLRFPQAGNMRAYIEKNAIVLLGNFCRPPKNPPSRGWLGRRCVRKKTRSADNIPRCGLWNNMHIKKDNYAPGFLRALKKCAAQTPREWKA